MPNCTINVMMFGGRRCGKTSVIAAMSQNFKNVFGGTSNLSLSEPDYFTMIAVEKKQQDIDSFFAVKPYGEFNTDGGADTSNEGESASSSGIIEYTLDLQIKGRNQSGITLNLYDFPGEWLEPPNKSDSPAKKAKKAEYDGILKDKMKTCGIIMIAIDTPYLMEPLSDVLKSEGVVGRWNDQRNYCRRIANMVKKSFMPDDGISPKMILFVPLKCEKYYINGQMGDVNRKIREAYKDLLNYVNTGDTRKDYEVVIAPILTFGKDTVLFSRFKEDEDGNPIMDADKRLPVVPLFKFQNREAKYSPQFCEQPLLYAVSYLLWHASDEKKREQEKRNLFEKLFQIFGETFWGFASVQDFLKQSDKIRANLKTSGDGYEILSDPLGLKRSNS